jgi:hypothetical protein
MYNLTTSSDVISFRRNFAVSVGYYGSTYNVMTSPDGIDWTGQLAADPYTIWTSVTWSGTQFVAVGGYVITYNVMTSPDGIDWTGQLAADPSTVWRSVTWSGTQFVAVGDSGSTYSVMTSPDGIDWTGQLAADLSTFWTSVIWSGTQFVAVGAYGSTYNVMTSPDGIDWTGQLAADPSTVWRSVTWSGTQFVAVGDSGSTYNVMTSPDGIDWTGQLAADPITVWRSVTWSGTQFAAVGSYGITYNVMTSPDGIDWTGQLAADPSTAWSSITWSGTQFIAVGGLGSTYNVMTSPTGIDWTGQMSGVPYMTNWSCILYVTISNNVALNSGFYSTSSLVDTFNNSEQVSNVALSYIEAEGKFLFTGNLTYVTTLTQEIAEILGLPFGTTLSSPIASNTVYHGLYPAANAYVVSSNIVSLDMNDYIWLDIEEFRTPFTTDARKLVLNPQGVYTTTSNTSARSFAIIPMDVPSGGIKSFKEAGDYPVNVTFPSRLDSLDRLTINWLDRNGKPLDFHGLDVNSFTLRLHTVHVPDQVERPVSLPPPVPFEKENKKVVWGAMLALVIGLMLIILAGKKRV